MTPLEKIHKQYVAGSIEDHELDDEIETALEADWRCSRCNVLRGPGTSLCEACRSEAEANSPDIPTFSGQTAYL